ncbi:hypothetical protein FPV67DRAFT_1537538 [Lyophyllum atratum]|nr:hypothetical protein FPV67DRAFT_1537538 [Lyophyllum atratum]
MQERPQMGWLIVACYILAIYPPFTGGETFSPTAIATTTFHMPKLCGTILIGLETGVLGVKFILRMHYETTGLHLPIKKLGM